MVLTTAKQSSRAMTLPPLQKLLAAFPQAAALDVFNLLPEELRAHPTAPSLEATAGSSPEILLDPAIAPIGHTRPSTRLLTRYFGFLDMAQFTSTVAALPAEEVAALLGVFRSLVREVAAARGCRIGCWLGDGVLIIGVDPGPVIATVMELSYRLQQADVPVCSGIAGGEVLLIDGSDHIGSPVNLASRLSDAAKPGQVLVSSEMLGHLPPWVQATESFNVKLKGLGKVRATLLHAETEANS